MFTGDLFRGIFDAPVPTVVQLAVLSLGLLALFLYVVIWPKMQARECARNLEMMRQQVRRIRTVHDAPTMDPRQRAWAIWAIGQVRKFTKRHRVHLEYLGISEAELTVIAYHLAHEQSNRASVPSIAPKAFVMDQGDLCQRVDEADAFDLEEIPPRPEPQRSVPPPVPEALRSTRPPELSEGDLVSDAPASGGSAKERRRARRAAERAAKERAAGGAKD